MGTLKEYRLCWQQVGKMAKADGGDDQSRKIVLKRGLGDAPVDPVCDSGIFCYGKPIFLLIKSFFFDKRFGYKIQKHSIYN